jgi:hypothetical protein
VAFELGDALVERRGGGPYLLGGEATGDALGELQVAAATSMTTARSMRPRSAWAVRPARVGDAGVVRHRLPRVVSREMGSPTRRAWSVRNAHQ